MIAETFAEYLSRDALHWTKLKEASRSPLHYRWRCDNDRPDSPSLLLGRAAHCAVFEPDRFPVDYAVFKGEARRGKAWEEFKAANEDRSILRADEYATCLDMRDAVHRHEVAKRYLAKGKAEQTIAWTDPLTGLACKGRADWISDSESALCDLKTTANLDPPWFAARVARLMYHGQLAFYGDGLRESAGLDLPARIIAVEAQPPHDVAVFVLDEDALWAGHNLALDLLRKVAACRTAATWPGRFEDAEQPLPLPPWAFPMDNNDGLDLTVNGQEVDVS